MLGEIFTGYRNTAKGWVHISLKPKRLKLVRGERKELFSAHTCPSLIAPMMGNGSSQLADHTENGTGVMAQGVQHHLDKMLQPMVLQTLKHKVQHTAGTSWPGSVVPPALQQLTATARQTQGKGIREAVSLPPAVLGKGLSQDVFMQLSFCSASFKLLSFCFLHLSPVISHLPLSSATSSSGSLRFT